MPLSEKPKILIVDDKNENLLALAGLLEDFNVDIVTATSGNDALAKVLKHDFVLVLMDVQMPMMDGFETATIMHTQVKTPIIFITAVFPEKKYISRGYEAGAVDYLFKPIDPKILRCKIKVFLDLYEQKMLLKNEIKVRKQAEEQLIEKSNKMERMSKELGDFIYIVSHDLKEPLFAIEGFTKRLAGKYDDKLDEKGKNYINRIKANTEIMSKRIYEIMEVIKIGTVKYDIKNNEVASIVKDMLDELESKIKDYRVKLIIQDDLPTVNCDSKRINDVFLNLVSNAIKFMSADNQKEIKIGSNNDGDCYRFFVEDTGIGIKKEHQEHIFKIFTRLKDIETEGTGVGLAIVKKIVELHKGKVWVESPVKNNRGTRFCFTIPMSEKLNDRR